MEAVDQASSAKARVPIWDLRVASYPGWVASKDKDEKGESSGDGATEEGSRETSASGPESTGEGKKSEPAGEPAPADTAKNPNWWSKLGSEARVAVISAAAAVFIGGIFSPIGHWVGGAIDEVHDFTRGYDGKRLDDMKETIEGRPFWQDGPSFSDAAFEYVGETDVGEGLYTTLKGGSTYASAVGVDELVNNAPEWEGVPVILVGRVFSESRVEGHGYNPFIYDEVVLTGNDQYVYVGTDSGSYDWNGIAAYVGVLIATGRALDDEVPAGVPTGYFIGVEGVDVDPNDPALRYELRTLEPDEFE